MRKQHGQVKITTTRWVYIVHRSSVAAARKWIARMKEPGERVVEIRKL